MGGEIDTLKRLPEIRLVRIYISGTRFLIASFTWLIEVWAGWPKKGTAMPSRSC